jgi:predicted phage tail protein
VSVEYYDPISFQKKSILAGSDVNARTVALTGCTSRAQAWREANFILRDTLYRRLNLQFSTEMEGFIPQFGSLIVVQNNTADWGQAGSVLAFSPQSVRLDTEFNWSSATQFSIRFCQPNGQPSAAISCSRGDADDIANLTVPSFVTQGTQYVLSTQQSQPINALVRRVSPTDNYHCGIEAVLDDPRVHQDPGAPPPETL